MAETKPTKVGQWATNANRTLEPALGEKQVGWEAANKPPDRFMNWLHNVAYQWFNWLNERLFDGGSAKDFEIRGVDIVAGTDVDGGDLELGGGSSTGDGGSEVVFKAAIAGLGAGATVRTPVVVAAVRETGNLEGSRDEGATFGRYIPQFYSSVVADQLGGLGTFASTYSIPANALRVGSTIRIKATGILVMTVTGLVYIIVKIGGKTVAELEYTNPDVNDDHSFYIDSCTTVRVIGASGILSSGSIGGFTEIPLIAGSVSHMITHQAISAANVDTTGALAVEVEIPTWGAGITGTLDLTQLVVDIA